MSEVTHILSAIEQGDRLAAEQLLPLVYQELRALAAQRLAQEQPGQTLQATALVHEAYLRLVQGDRAAHWNSRAHFFGAAAEAMRRILIDNARRKAATRHGGAMRRQALDPDAAPEPEPREDLLALDEALGRLEAEDPRALANMCILPSRAMALKGCPPRQAGKAPPKLCGQLRVKECRQRRSV